MLEFDWDEANLSHIALHSVTATEAEQALNGPCFELDFYIRQGEERVEEVGITSAGRILKLVTTIRAGKVRVVTAYDAVKLLRSAYRDFLRKLYE